MVGRSETTNNSQTPKPSPKENEELVRKVVERVWKLLERDLRTEYERDSRKRR